MVEKEKINNISYSKDDVDIKKNIIGKGNENDPIFNKSKTYRNSVKTKTKRGRCPKNYCATTSRVPTKTAYL